MNKRYIQEHYIALEYENRSALTMSEQKLSQPPQELSERLASE